MSSSRILTRRMVSALAITVAALLAAPCVLQSQTVDLPSALKAVVYRNAPFFVHEEFLSASPVGASDHMLREDFDHNHDGTRKAEDAADRSLSVDRTASIYFSAVENGYFSDQGYYFLGYYYYHPRDNGEDFLAVCCDIWVHGAGHEHDMEGAFFVVKKNAYSPYGTVVAALTQQHGELVPYKNYLQTAVSGSEANGDDYYGGIYFWNDSRYGMTRPVVMVRGRSHGAHMAQGGCDVHALYGDGGKLNRDSGYGIRADNSGDQFFACIHDGYDAIVYRPQMIELLLPSNGLPQADAIPIDTTHGVYTYQLLDMSTG